VFCGTWSSRITVLLRNNYALPGNWIQMFQGNVMSSSLRVVNPRTFPYLKMRTLWCLETSLSVYHLTQFHVQDERNSELYHYKNLKTRTACRVMSVCKNWLCFIYPAKWIGSTTLHPLSLRSLSAVSFHLYLDLLSSVFS
jgi:hypothetical protein